MMFKTIALVAALFMCSSPLFAQRDESMSIVSGGVTRSVLIHLPMDNPPANLPLLLCFHGTGGTSESIRNQTAFNALADQYKFIVVYPQALRIGNDIQWNVYVDNEPGHGGVGVADAPDDVQFVKDLISSFVARNGIDVNRVFATGLSNGGFMSYALSMLAAESIRAIAPVAANLWANDVYLTQLIQSGTVRPMPVMHVHGTADNVVDYPDPDNLPKAYEEYPLFVAGRVCNATTYKAVIPLMAGVDKLVFCDGATEVSLIRITGMGHAWTNGTYPTSSEIVHFFGLDHPSAVPLESESLVRILSANSVDDAVHLELNEAAIVELISSGGITRYNGHHERGSVAIHCSDLPSGAFVLRVRGRSGSSTFASIVMIVH